MINVNGDMSSDIDQNTTDIAVIQDTLDAHLHKTLLDLSFPFDAHTISAEAGDIPDFAAAGWVANKPEIVKTTYQGLDVFVFPGTNSPETGNFILEKHLALQDFQNLHSFGGVFGGEVALDADLGELGFFASYELNIGTQILQADGITPVFTANYKRFGLFFQHDNTNVTLIASGGVTGLIFNGVDTASVTDWQGNTVINIVPEILPGEFFKFEIHIRDGLDKPAFLYVNDILVGNPTITAGRGFNTVIYEGGSATGTLRYTYVRNFGDTINTSENVVIANKADLENSRGVKIVIPNGTRDYSILLEKDLHLPVGFTYEIISQTIGTLAWSPKGTCSNTSHIAQFSCEKLKETWDETSFCEINTITDQTICDTGSPGLWDPIKGVCVIPSTESDCASSGYLWHDGWCSDGESSNKETCELKPINDWNDDNNGIAGTIEGFSSGKTELKGLMEIVKTNILKDGAQFVAKTTLTEFESLRTGMISYSGMSLLVVDGLTVVFSARMMRFVNEVRGSSTIVTRPSVEFEFTEGLQASDDLGVVHFYEAVDGTIFGSAKTDWSTPIQRRDYAYLGNADVNLSKNGFVQANNPLVSAFGLLNAFGDYLAIGGSIKSAGGKVINFSTNLALNISGYTAVAWGRNFSNRAMPHTPTSTDIFNADLHLGYRNSDVSMVFGASSKNLNPTAYQKIENTNLSTVPAGKFTIQRAFQYPGTDYNMILFGSTLYDSLDQAILNASTERYNLHPSLVPACFLAYIVVKQDVTDLDDAIHNTKTAAILNYNGRTHPPTIGAEESPSLSLEAGGELRSMVDQYANDITDPIIFVDFEIGENSLYGCEWSSVSKSIKNTSQKDMVVNIVPQVGRRSTGQSVGLEIFIDISYDNGANYNVDIADTYATYQSIEAQIGSLTASVLIFRVVPNAQVRIGMMLSNDETEVGLISNGKGNPNPGASLSGRHLPSCILTVT